MKRGPKPKQNASAVRAMLLEARKGGTYQEVADRTGVSRNTVQRIMNMTLEELKMTYGPEAWPR